jgi:alkylation response protein AidB-like acyl-CoA dehydrogenase
MRFDFTEEQQLWHDTVHRFVDTEGGGREYARQCDVERRYPYELYDKVAKQGWLGLLVPEEYGGMGADAMFYAIFMGAMGKYSVASGRLRRIGVHREPVRTARQRKARCLPAFVNGRVSSPSRRRANAKAPEWRA